MVTKLFNSFEIQFFIVYCSPDIVLGNADLKKKKKLVKEITICLFIFSSSSLAYTTAITL